MKGKKICNLKNNCEINLVKIIKASLLDNDVVAICGLHPWKGTKSVYNEKLGNNNIFIHNNLLLSTDKIHKNRRIAHLFALKTGKKTKGVYSIIQHRKYPWLHSLINRVVVAEDAFFEYKEVKHFTSNEDILSASLLLQLQYKMLVSGLSFCYFAIVTNNKIIDIIKINQSQQIRDNLLIKCNSFWNCVKNKRLPYPDGKAETSQLINNLFPIARDNDHRNLPNCYELLKVYDELVKEKNKLEVELRVIEQKLKLMLGQATSAYVWNRKIEWSNELSSSFNYLEFKKKYPNIYEKFIELSNTRIFKIY